MKLDGVAIRDFAPFEAQNLKFGTSGSDSDRGDVHLFVGQNGTGKTRLLSLLLAACGNAHELNDRQNGRLSAIVYGRETKDETVVWTGPNLVLHAIAHPLTDSAVNQFMSLGTISGGRMLQPHASLAAISKGTAAMAFTPVAAIRDDKVQPMAPVDWGASPSFLLFSRPQNDGASLCQAVSNMKIRAGMFLAGNPSGRVDRTVRMAERLEHTLKEITGRQFIFVVEQAGANVHLKVSWGDVRMRLHHLPDGLRAIIGWLATCVAKIDLMLPDEENPLDQPVLLFLDEPESHLHPAWQRKILPALQRLLPKAQIFVATHSPFVVSSVNQGWIYVFKANDDGHVRIEGPRECSKGDSYIDAVEEVLGVKEWYDPETELMLQRFRDLREKALATFSNSDKEAMFFIANEIAQRSESLDVMMGHELKQFAGKERLASR